MDAALRDAKYISLVTFRRDGREVATPVWVVTVSGKLCFYTNGNSGKVKRIRATGRVKAAPSDGRGNPHGPYTEGTGRILTDPAVANPVFAAIAAKYGWQYRLISAMAFLAGRRNARIAVELSV